MIIDPRMLFPMFIDFKVWKHHALSVTEKMKKVRITCGCMDPKILAKSPKAREAAIAAGLTYQDVVLTEEVFKGQAGDNRKVRFLVGICNQCKVIHWACDHFNWVAWLNHYELLATALEVMGIDYNTHEDVAGGFIEILGPFKIEFDSKGWVLPPGRK